MECQRGSLITCVLGEHIYIFHESVLKADVHSERKFSLKSDFKQPCDVGALLTAHSDRTVLTFRGASLIGDL